MGAMVLITTFVLSRKEGLGMNFNTFYRVAVGVLLFLLGLSLLIFNIQTMLHFRQGISTVEIFIAEQEAINACRERLREEDYEQWRRRNEAERKREKSTPHKGKQEETPDREGAGVDFIPAVENGAPPGEEVVAAAPSSSFVEAPSSRRVGSAINPISPCTVGPLFLRFPVRSTTPISTDPSQPPQYPRPSPFMCCSAEEYEDFRAECSFSRLQWKPPPPAERTFNSPEEKRKRAETFHRVLLGEKKDWKFYSILLPIPLRQDNNADEDPNGLQLGEA